MERNIGLNKDMERAHPLTFSIVAVIDMLLLIDAWLF